MDKHNTYLTGFLPYGLAAFLIGIVGGFSTSLGPAFVQDIGLAYNTTTWTALAQAISTAACAPILGTCGDVYGRKPTLIFGMALFTLGNICSAVASTLPFMLISRFLVGLGTAAMAPVILSYIVTQFPPDRVATGFSLYMLISSASVVFGPTLGSLLITNYGWRTMVWVCTGICFAVLIPCLFLNGGKSNTRSFGQFDFWGSLLILIFFGFILCIPSFGQNFGWNSTPFLWVLTGCIISFALLILAESKAAHPILSPSFIRRRVFILSVLTLLLTQGLMQANMTNTIVFVRYTQPGNDLISGYAISVMYLGMSLGAVWIGPQGDRREPKWILTISLLITALGCGLLLLFTEETSPWLMMTALGTLGLGLGGNGTILMKVALSGLPPSESGAGTGTYGLFRDLAAPFGVAVFVPLFTNQITAGLSTGLSGKTAAVHAIHLLSGIELICIAAGIITVLLIPGIHQKGDRP